MNPLHKTEHYEFTYDKSSRNRIIATSKTLFASLGYDNSSTALIARNAGTSESRLVKDFGGKAGILETIFSEGWDQVVAQLGPCLESAGTLSSRLASVPRVVFEVFSRDLELKALVLLEGHHMRESARSLGADCGYGRFIALIDRALLDRALPDCAVSPLCVRSAILGMVDGGLKAQVLANRAGFPAAFSADDFAQVVSCFLGDLTTESTFAATAAGR